MLSPIYEKKFSKDLELFRKRGKNLEKLKNIMDKLIQEKPLPIKNRNHKLKGDYLGTWECHIEPDWLLVYRLTDTEIHFVRTGTHSDLF